MAIFYYFQNTGSDTNNTPFIKHILLQYYKHVISHLSTSHDILGEMFKLKHKLLHPYYYLTNHTQAGVTSARPRSTQY